MYNKGEEGRGSGIETKTLTCQIPNQIFLPPLFFLVQMCDSHKTLSQLFARLLQCNIFAKSASSYLRLCMLHKLCNAEQSETQMLCFKPMITVQGIIGPN